MKTLKFSSLVVLAVVAVLSSCSKEDKPQILDVDKAELRFAVGADTLTFNITSDGDWGVEANGMQYGFGINKGFADWYSVEPAGGTGNETVTVISKEGTAGNKATLKIKYDSKQKTVELKQDSAPENQ